MFPHGDTSYASTGVPCHESGSISFPDGL